MIYDAIHFFNETEVLALRLEHMTGMVDRHFIFESVKTFSGNDKGFLLDLEHPRIRPFKERIIHIRSTADIPLPACKLHNWRREFYQRDLLRVSVLPLCESGDLIFVCDLDQLPKLESWKAAMSMAWNHGVACLEMTNHGYYFNRVFRSDNPDDLLHMSMINNARLVTPAFLTSPPAATPSMDSELIRSLSYRVSYFHDPRYDITNSGWHLSSMGGLQSVLFKLDSFSHANEIGIQTRAQLMNTHFTELANLYTFEYPIDQLPVCIQQRQEYLRQAGFLL